MVNSGLKHSRNIEFLNSDKVIWLIAKTTMSFRKITTTKTDETLRTETWNTCHRGSEDWGIHSPAYLQQYFLVISRWRLVHFIQWKITEESIINGGVRPKVGQSKHLKITENIHGSKTYAGYFLNCPGSHFTNRHAVTSRFTKWFQTPNVLSCHGSYFM